MTQRLPGLPSPEQVTELLADEFERAGYEIDAVVVEAAARPACIRVVVDGDLPLDLDGAAALSRSASELMDTIDTGAAPYVLEVSSPGVERPLTAPKQFRRARGRKVVMTLSDGADLTGRLGAATDDAVDVVVRSGRGLNVRRIQFGDIREAIVQVEFSPPNREELDLAGGGARGTEAGS